MKISFYAPFKPLAHPLPSGDQVIATGLYRFLEAEGHHLEIASELRTRWIYWKPWCVMAVPAERRKLLTTVRQSAVDLWLTYHSYYKGPDMLGPYVTGRLAIPYVIFQGAYATKRRRHWRSRAGFYLNRMALLAADHVFANKRVDYRNLKRLLPEERVSYTAPGIDPKAFESDGRSRQELRRSWRVDAEPVILSAAMFRRGVKTQSLTWVIRVCGILHQMGRDFRLVVIGDGANRRRLEKMAADKLPGRAVFTGKVSRDQMYRYFSAGDVFVFPGIGESLGMVYLEAQSCGLPVVAFDEAGVPEVVRKNQTGFLLPAGDTRAYVRAVDRLLTSADERKKMGRAASTYIRQAHDLQRNYRAVERKLREIAGVESPGFAPHHHGESAA